PGVSASRPQSERCRTGPQGPGQSRSALRVSACRAGPCRRHDHASLLNRVERRQLKVESALTPRPVHRHRLSGLAGALVLVLGWAGGAFAQPAAARPVVVLPRAEQVTEVPYPEGGQGDATVVLVLVIEKDGTVRSAQAESGREPFATAAR